MSGSLQFNLSERDNMRRQYDWRRCNTLARTARRKTKPNLFASRFLSDTKKKYAIIELELLVVVWGLEHFRLYIYGKPNKLLTDHQAFESFIEQNRSNKT